jgi:2-polyprenyl-3-methyl-5-hydroxy-6-metoxy-1,4-benzoquinol methylase
MEKSGMPSLHYAVDAKTEWNARTASMKPSRVDSVVFSDLFEQFLPKSDKLTCIEIGALPGNYLAFFHNSFGYRVTGIDFSDNQDVFYKTMKINGIDDYTYIKDDFQTHKFSETYDIVTGFGFIEHFENVSTVIDKMATLVSPGGYLIMSVPNFRFLQHIYHYYFDKENLDIHNLKAMRLGFLKRTARTSGLKKIVAKYYGNLSVWKQDTSLDQDRQRLVNSIHRWVQRNGHKLPNSRFYSPYIILIYRKPRD